MVTVLLVRHADIALPRTTDDPALDDAGRARATELAHVAGAAGVTAVFTSAFARTRQTAAPLAGRLGLAPQEAPPDVAERAAAGAFGAVVLVVGHSNTVPATIDALGAGPAPAIAEDEFDHLFVVTTAGGQASLLHLRYGQAAL